MGELQLLQVNTIISLIELIFIIVTIIYGKKTLDDSILARRMELLRSIIKEIGCEEIRELRAWIYSCTTNEKLNEEKVRKLAVAYDRMAFMLLQDKKTLALYREFQGNEVIFLWEKIEDCIYQIRTKRNNDQYCNHFEKLFNTMNSIKDRSSNLGSTRK